MKILLNSYTPFLLAHGGAQIQIEQTKAALVRIGVETEYLRWYDGNQTGDVLHFFGRISTSLLKLAHAKGMKVVVADLLTEQGSRPPGRLRTQKLVSKVLRRVLPGSLSAAFNWDAYRMADACIALTSHEAYLMNYLFQAPPEKLRIVPNGVEDAFLQSQPAKRGPWLVCTATITGRKRIWELAEAAVKAQTPVWIIGVPYSPTDPYAMRFVELAKKNPTVIRYEGAINDRAQMARIYREARGFVLLSAMESLSLSALEAAACECPLLLSDLPWARTSFKETVSYCPVTSDVGRTAAELRRFYDAAPSLKPPGRPLSWMEVAKQIRDVYDFVLKTSR